MLQRTLATLGRSLLGGLSFHGLAALRAASMVAVAGLLLTMVSPPAEAHSLHGCPLDFFTLSAVSESGEVGSDGPYVVMTVANLASRELVVGRTGVFGAPVVA
jgi:hypothetical protein